MVTYHTVGDGRENPCSKALEHVNVRQEGMGLFLIPCQHLGKG